MKSTIKMLCILALLLGTKSFSQNTINFDESGYESAIKRSNAEHKPVFYMMYATWCPHCNKMKAEVFTQPTVAEFLNKNFIVAAQDIDKPEAEAIKAKYGVVAYPTFLFINNDGTLLYAINGEYKVENLMEESKNAMVPEKQLPYLKKQFYADPSNSDKCLAYLIALRKGTDRQSLSAAAHTYLETQSDAQLVSETNWKVIANAVTDINSREFQYVLTHQTEFAKVSSEDRVNRKIVSIVTELLRPYTENLEFANYQKQRLIAKSIKLPSVDLLVFNYDLEITEKTANWTEYQKATEEGVQKYIWSDQQKIKDIGQVYLKNIKDQDGLKNAIKWVGHTLEVSDSYDANLLIAKLYQKLNDKKQALVFAKKTKDLALSLGFGSADADQLIAQLATK